MKSNRGLTYFAQGRQRKHVGAGASKLRYKGWSQEKSLQTESMCRGHKVRMYLDFPRTCRKIRAAEAEWLKGKVTQDVFGELQGVEGGWITWRVPDHSQELGFYSSVLRGHWKIVIRTVLWSHLCFWRSLSKVCREQVRKSGRKERCGKMVSCQCTRTCQPKQDFVTD